MMKRNVLLLNKNWQPIASAPWRTAVKIVIRGHGYVVDHRTFERLDWVAWVATHSAGIDADVDRRRYIQTGVRLIECPKVVTLARFGGLPKRRLAFSRNGIYARDSHRGKPQCQYCGSYPTGRSLTLDHVIPRAQGGKTQWENCVVACEKCNMLKADRTPEQAGMRLLSKPKRPEVFQALLGELEPEWEVFVKQGNTA